MLIATNEGNEEGHRDFQGIDTDPVGTRLGAVDSDDDPFHKDSIYLKLLV